jgi:hypothetical protein
MRFSLVAVLGVAVYYTLLGCLYARVPYAAIPHWWREHLFGGPAAVVSWFTVLNIVGALLAAIPVAIGLILSANTRRILLGLVIGVVAGLYIVVGGLLEFGVPASAGGWAIDMAQLIAVSLSVAAAVALIQSCPLTTRWSGP